MLRAAPLAVLLLALTQPRAGTTQTPQPVSRARDQLVRYAEGLLDPRHRRATEGNHVVVVTDSPFPETEVAMARNFEAVFRVLQNILRVPDAGGSLDESLKVRAYLFKTQQQYESFAKYAEPRAAGRTAGMYFSGFGILAFHLESYTQPWLRHVMLHECTHAFLDRRVQLTDRFFPSWLNEGLAEYIGLSDVSNGQVHVGVFTTKTRHESFEGTLIVRSQAADQLSAARRAIRHELTLDELLTIDPTSIADDDRLQEYYAASWLFVDLLRSGRPTWPEQQFPALVREIGAGHSDRETLETVYGLSAKDLETGLARHIKNYKLVRGWSAPED